MRKLRPGDGNDSLQIVHQVHKGRSFDGTLELWTFFLQLGSKFLELLTWSFLQMNWYKLKYLCSLKMLGKRTTTGWENLDSSPMAFADQLSFKFCLERLFPGSQGLWGHSWPDLQGSSAPQAYYLRLLLLLLSPFRGLQRWLDQESACHTEIQGLEFRVQEPTWKNEPGGVYL